MSNKKKSDALRKNYFLEQVTKNSFKILFACKNLFLEKKLAM
jgi:hypothetical protein